MISMRSGSRILEATADKNVETIAPVLHCVHSVVSTTVKFPDTCLSYVNRGLLVPLLPERVRGSLA